MTFLAFSEKISVFPKKFQLSPKISDDLFLSHRPFSCFCHFPWGAKSVADLDKGGSKILTYRQFHNILSYFHIILSSPEGGQTPLPTSMGGPWLDLPPLDPPLSTGTAVTGYLKLLNNKHISYDFIPIISGLYSHRISTHTYHCTPALHSKK